MEGCIRELVKKEKEEIDKLTEKRLIKEKSLKEEIQLRDMRKNIEKLEKEEETLKIQLEKLRKENFSLRASINAWQSVREKKIDEFKQAQMELNELYNEIWKGREEFCSKADDVNYEFGILSDWWKTQMEYVNDVQNIAKKRVKDDENEEDIKRSQTGITDLKKEIEILTREQESSPDETQQHQQQHKKKDSSTTEETKTRADIPTNKTLRKNGESNSRGKKADFSEKEDRMELCSEEIIPPDNELYSLMDIDKMKMANRNKKAFHGKFRKLFN